MQISRVTRSKQTARKVYDDLSRYYDLLAGSSETPMMLRGLRLLDLHPGERVLEVGCGTGRALVEMARQVGSPGAVHAIDLSSGMLLRSRNRMVEEQYKTMGYLLQADGLQLPYRSGSFSAVFLSFTLELFDTPEIPLVLQECSRVLEPSGRIGIVSMYQPSHPGRIVRLYEWMHDRFPAYIDCRPIDAGDMLRQAGFKMVDQAIESMWGLPVALAAARKP